MSFAIFKGETSIKDLVSRLFSLSGKGSQSKADQAASALLQANPHLKDISKVPVGSVINVPATAPPLNPAEVAPATVSRSVAIAGQARQTLDRLSQRLTEIDARAADGASALLTLAQSKQTQTIAQNSPDLKAQLPILVTSLQTLAKETTASQGLRNQALSEVRTSLQALPQGKS